MRILLVNADYPGFLEGLYAAHPGLERQPFDAQMQARNRSLFGVADFYSRHLSALGHEAWDVHANNEPMQRAWATEHGVRLSSARAWRFRLRRGIVPWLCRVQNDAWLLEALEAQVRRYRPDVLLNHWTGLDTGFLRRIKPLLRLLVCQVASPLPQDRDFGVYDLVISSLPNFVERFRRQGVRSELLRFAFEPSILEAIGSPERTIPVSFVGSLFAEHASRIRWLERVCTGAEVEVWGSGVATLAPDSPVLARYRGASWGIDMYRTLARSRITLNHHIDIAEQYANNMRLFEATGAGAMLLTDAKVNLGDMFESGREVVTYADADECVEKIAYYLAHDEERKEIAQAGQRRTLSEHTYGRRMAELADMLERRLRG